MVATADVVGGDATHVRINSAEDHALDTHPCPFDKYFQIPRVGG